MFVRELKEIIRHYHLGISPRRMGQNFLVDGKVLSRIALALNPTAEDHLFEIGAGLGALTSELIASGGPVVAVEKDNKFVEVLKDRFKEVPNLTVVHSDILKLKLSDYASSEKELLVVGNIPYSMTAKILEFLLKERRWIKRALLTIQKEVAQRIVAPPGSKTYSSVSILVQVAFKPSIAFTIAPSCFYPQPKVTSAVLRLDPLPVPAVPPEEEEWVLKFTRQLFLHRRKTLLNAAAFLAPKSDKEFLRGVFLKAGIDPIRRPETLHLEEILRLSRLLQA